MIKQKLRQGKLDDSIKLAQEVSEQNRHMGRPDIEDWLELAKARRNFEQKTSVVQTLIEKLTASKH